MNAPEPHHRINEQLNEYWQTLRRERPMPLESEVVMDDLADIWDSCFLLSVKQTGFAYDYLGTSIIAAYGDDLTGKEITETLLYPHPPSLVNTFKNVVLNGVPAVDDSEFVNSDGQTVKYRSCVLPLASSNAGKVTFLLGGMKWKAFR